MENRDQPYLTVQEVAARLRTSEVTVQRWLRSGRLRGTRLGGTRMGWRVAEDDLREFERSGIRSPREFVEKHSPLCLYPGCGLHAEVVQHQHGSGVMSIRCANDHVWEVRGKLVELVDWQGDDE